jgi:aromatic ring hydroxylase
VLVDGAERVVEQHEVGAVVRGAREAHALALAAAQVDAALAGERRVAFVFLVCWFVVFSLREWC